MTEAMLYEAWTRKYFIYSIEVDKMIFSILILDVL